MRGASLLLVFLVAKLAIVWGHSAPLTCLALLAYVTASNVLLVVAVLAAAAGLPRLLRQVPRQLVRMGLVCTIAVVLLGPMAGSRVDTRGMDRNVITALIGSGLPRVAARAGAGD